MTLSLCSLPCVYARHRMEIQPDAPLSIAAVAELSGLKQPICLSDLRWEHCTPVFNDRDRSLLNFVLMPPQYF